jgi:hypothetical protein
MPQIINVYLVCESKNMTIMDKLKEHPAISMIIVCVPVVSTAIGIATWFYEKKIDNINLKCEADISILKNEYEKKISTSEKIIESIKTDCESKKEKIIQKEKTVYTETDQQKKTCEITNPLPEKDIRWHETDFTIEGKAINIDAVWIVVKLLNESKKAYSILRSKVNENNLWEATVQLVATTNNTERIYNIFIYPDNIANNHYFNDLILNKPKNQSFFDLLFEEPIDYCQSIKVKRIKN